MSIYVEEVVAELESLHDYANRLLAKFDASVAPSELLLDIGILVNRLKNADQLLPDGISIDWGRKLHFMNYYLKRDQPDDCRADLVALCETELPEAIKKVQVQGNTSQYTDPELRAAVSPLLRTQQFNSAIRAAFVLLTERIRRKYDLPMGVDGATMSMPSSEAHQRSFPTSIRGTAKQGAPICMAYMACSGTNTRTPIHLWTMWSWRRRWRA